MFLVQDAFRLEAVFSCAGIHGCAFLRTAGATTCTVKISHRACCITNSFKQRDSAERPAEANLRCRPAEPTRTQEERKKTAQIKEAELVLSLKGCRDPFCSLQRV